MRLFNVEKYRIALKFSAACIFCIIIYRSASRHPEQASSNHSKPQVCRVQTVKRDGASCRRYHAALSEFHTCFWNITVVSKSASDSRPLLAARNHFLNSRELALFKKLDGCNSTSECGNEELYCSYGIEDPSDALWLREYESSTKFVVIFKVGIASLLFFVSALICDGSIFEPRRPGISNSVASFLLLVAISSLLYILLIPRNLQLSLYGSGPLQSAGFVVLVMTIAAMLPGVAIIWINVAVFFVFFLGFLLEQAVYVFVGILHFLGVLSLYQVENAFLHLRIIYTHDVLEQAEFDNRLLTMSRRFLSRIRQNWYLQRLPRAMEEDAMQIVSNVLPEHLYDELLHEGVPRIEFENLDREPENESFRPRQSSQSEDIDEVTPLLQENGRTATI